MFFNHPLWKYLKVLFLSFMAFFTVLEAKSALAEKPLVVVVVSYNNINWVDRNIGSIFSQDYDNYRVVYIDDCSPDGTADAVETLVKSLGQEHRFTLVRNIERAGSPLANHYKAIHGYCRNDEIVVCVDGDDWLATDKALKTVNENYRSRQVWLTHGTFSEYHFDGRNGQKGWSTPIPKKIVAQRKFRSFRCPSHMKTFYAWLFKKVKLEDLQYKGIFYPASGDQAMMFPMIEMAGERHAFISKVLYIYNMTNPLGESVVATQLQRDCENHVRHKKPYERLKKPGR